MMMMMMMMMMEKCNKALGVILHCNCQKSNEQKQIYKAPASSSDDTMKIPFPQKRTSFVAIQTA